MVFENEIAELSSAEIDKLLEIWLAKQSPLNLQDAIYLLVRKDPKVQNDAGNRISFAKETENAVETRALTHVLKSFANPNSPLISVASVIPPKISGVQK